MIPELKPTAELVGHHREYAKAAAYVVGLDTLPLGRVINDAKVTDHHAIIPTRSEHNLDKMSDDDRRVYGEGIDESADRDEDDEGRSQNLPKLEQGEDADVREVAAEAKETKPPRRY